MSLITKTVILNMTVENWANFVRPNGGCDPPRMTNSFLSWLPSSSLSHLWREREWGYPVSSSGKVWQQEKEKPTVTISLSRNDDGKAWRVTEAGRGSVILLCNLFNLFPGWCSPVYTFRTNLLLVLFLFTLQRSAFLAPTGVGNCVQCTPNVSGEP